MISSRVVFYLCSSVFVVSLLVFFFVACVSFVGVHYCVVLVLCVWGCFQCAAHVVFSFVMVGVVLFCFMVPF